MELFLDTKPVRFVDGPESDGEPVTKLRRRHLESFYRPYQLPFSVVAAVVGRRPRSSGPQQVRVVRPRVYLVLLDVVVAPRRLLGLFPELVGPVAERRRVPRFALVVGVAVAFVVTVPFLEC